MAPQPTSTPVLITVTGPDKPGVSSVLFAVLLPVDTLSGEIDSGVMQTLASKPIGRAPSDLEVRGG